MSPQHRLLHLASASPRRRDILTALGLTFTSGGVGVDESPRPGEPADALVLRLAASKAAAAVGGRADSVIIGSDTEVVLGERVFGKPRDEDDAIEMLAALSGREHEVLSAVAVIADGGTDTRLARTRVRFRDIDPDEARLYWQSGEPAGKAGGYAIQGLGGVFVSGITGSYSGVVGLPVFETAELLGAAGIRILGMPGEFTDNDLGSHE